MEYYEGYDNDKFIRFKDRINRLLTKPEVFSKMNQKKPPTGKESSVNAYSSPVRPEAKTKVHELKVQALSSVDVNKDALMYNHKCSSKRLR